MNAKELVNRNCIYRIKSSLEDIEQDFYEFEKVIIEKLSSSEAIHVVYSGFGYAEASAYMFYWVLKELVPQILVEASPLEDLLYHVIAYREQSGLHTVVFAEPGSENTLLRLMDTLSVMNVPVTAFSPPIPPHLLERYREIHTVIEYHSKEPGIELAWMTLRLALKLANKVASSPRTRRVLEEISRIDEELLTDLISHYTSFIKGIINISKEYRNLIVVYSSTLKSAAPILRKLYLKIGRMPLFISLSSLPPLLSSGLIDSNSMIVILATSVEEALLKEIKFKLSMARSDYRIYEAVIATDPLTAPFYAIILAEYAICMASH